MKSEGHPHKCKECKVDYRHYRSDDDKCKEPPETVCGACCKILDIKKDNKK